MEDIKVVDQDIQVVDQDIEAVDQDIEDIDYIEIGYGSGAAGLENSTGAAALWAVRSDVSRGAPSRISCRAAVSRRVRSGRQPEITREVVRILLSKGGGGSHQAGTGEAHPSGEDSYFRLRPSVY